MPSGRIGSLKLTSLGGCTTLFFPSLVPSVTMMVRPFSVGANCAESKRGMKLILKIKIDFLIGFFISWIVNGLIGSGIIRRSIFFNTLKNSYLQYKGSGHCPFPAINISPGTQLQKQYPAFFEPLLVPQGGKRNKVNKRKAG